MGFEVWAVARPRTSPRTSAANVDVAYLDEMAVVIAGRQFWLWRAVDKEGEVLNSLVQRRREQGGSRETDALATQETRLRA